MPHIEITQEQQAAERVTGEKLTGEKSTLRFHFDIPKHIQQPLITTIVKELLGVTDSQGNPIHCPSTGVSAARTNRIMEEIFCPAGKPAG